MPSSRTETQLRSAAARLRISALVCAFLLAAFARCTQAQEAEPAKTDQSYTATSQTSVDHTSPVRTTETHSSSGNRTVDTQRVELLGPDGHYQPDSATETETIQVSPTTTRTVVRTYRWDVNGQRTLAQVTEAEARSSANGEAHVVRTTSSADVNGTLHLAQREVAETKATGPGAQETRTTVYLADANGRFTPSAQTQESQKRTADHTVEVKTTTLQPGVSGNWQVLQVTEKTVTEDGKNRTTEERVSRPDTQGRLSEYSRTVGRETEAANGEKRTTVESYTPNTPGLADEGRLRLNERVTTVQNADSSGKTTEQQVEQRDPASPSAGLQPAAKTKYTVHYAASGTSLTKTMQTRDINGNFTPVAVETQKSDQPPPTQPQPTPPPDADKSK